MTTGGDIAKNENDADNLAMLAKGKRIMQRLEEIYPQAPEGFLDHTDAFTLLVAVVLSAQSLDIKVNEITPKLFEVGGTPEKMRDLGEEKIRELIKQIGLAPQKAKNIARLSGMICDEFDGHVPDTFGKLESLPGVGHKTASVVMMQAFNKYAFPVDTHIHRLACRWGCGHAKSVDKTEAALKSWFPDPSTWGDLHVRIILFGREHCPARKHDMDLCPICSFAATKEARMLNKQNPNKFIGSLSHKDPYSILDVPKVDPVSKEAANGISPGTVTISKKRAAVAKTGTKRTMRKKAVVTTSTVQSTSNGEAKPEDDEVDEIIKKEEAPAKRARRGRKSAKTTVVKTVEVEENKTVLVDDDKRQEKKTKRRVRKTTERIPMSEDQGLPTSEPPTEEGRSSANGPALRSSSRIRARKARGAA